MLTIQDVPSMPVLAAFDQLVGERRAVRLRDAAGMIRHRLAGGTLWHVNSTPAGGGVAEMLRTLLPLYAELGVRAAWAVVGGDDQFFRITKRLGAALYGSDGDGESLGPAERSAYLSALSPATEKLADLIGPRDIVILHDHQTAGLVTPLARRAAEVYWRCHVGVDEPTEASERGWDFVVPLLADSRSLIFSVEQHVPPRLRGRELAILPPFISPFGFKNCGLPVGAIQACLSRCGLSAGDDEEPSAALRTAAGTVQLRSVPSVICDGPRRPGDPLITQVSRWDRLKDMTGLLDAVTAYVPRGHLALVGPDPSAIADDLEQQAWYADCLNRWRALPAEQRRRVTLVALPMTDLDENAVLVNAAQRASDVVVQKSLAEGFGLTVTEAMWKARVVVGSAVGGIRAQITHGVDGLLLPDPRDLTHLGELITTVLESEVSSRDIGARAHQRVRTEFLPDREVTTTASIVAQERVPS